eukprot:GFKZ01001657.1.p2 GENE.GFKZ01001657.1~~GFKZ01001657.1.p2  ORF type:complete len:196 (+),score=31.26 GFKZ01001657.1:680-1267(+)
MWRARISRTWDWLRSRKLVGEDQHHLYYTEFIEKGKPERRYVEYKDNDITNASDRMHVEWWSWLHNRRDTVPSPDEIALSEMKQQQLAQRVAILEAEDEKQRLRQFAGAGPNSTSRAKEEEGQARRRNKVMMRLAKAAAPKERATSDGAIIPNTEFNTQQDSGEGISNPDKDPTGSGEDFQPGSWQPSSNWRRKQ